jgi:hypothetical protein
MTFLDKKTMLRVYIGMGDEPPNLTHIYLYDKHGITPSQSAIIFKLKPNLF